nr:MAG TPA: Putative transferase, nesg, ydcK, Structural Genomics.38A [Caudoviricetes sp.]
MKKYRLTEETIRGCNRTLYRIQALRDFANVKEGDIGGYIEAEKNLSQIGNSWVSGNAWVSDNAQVSGDACVSGEAWVSDDARVYGNAQVSDNAQVSGDAWVSDDARVYGDAWVSGNAQVSGNAWVSGDACVSGNARVYGNADIKKEGDICCMSGFGSEYMETTAFREKNGGVHVSCGCFYGNLDEFCKMVESTHGNTLYGREYKKMIEMLKIHFEVEP